MLIGWSRAVIVKSSARFPNSPPSYLVALGRFFPPHRAHHVCIVSALQHPPDSDVCIPLSADTDRRRRRFPATSSSWLRFFVNLGIPLMPSSVNILLLSVEVCLLSCWVSIAYTPLSCKKYTQINYAMLIDWKFCGGTFAVHFAAVHFCSITGFNRAWLSTYFIGANTMSQ